MGALRGLPGCAGAWPGLLGVLQEVRPLPGPEIGLLSNTQK